MSSDGPNDTNLFFAGGPAKVQLVYAASASDVLVRIKDRLATTGGDHRLVAVPFVHLRPVKSLVEDTLSGLAEVALALWPDWYGEAIPFASLERSTFAFEERLAETLAASGHRPRPVSLPWVKAAMRLCRAGTRPRPRGFPPAVQAAQLALALDPGSLLIALCVGDDRPGEGLLLGLARTAEWLARQTEARVLVVVPQILASSRELDSISFEAVTWSPLPERADVPSHATEGDVHVWPVIGRPHPYSPGEQRLASRLEDDELLSGLFRFNVWVETRFESHHLVDLLWPEGKVVIEVDGYEFHANRYTFSLDRRRDYELTVSGYLVLRLPHDEVMADVELAIEKIRDMVRFRREHFPPTETRTS